MATASADRDSVHQQLTKLRMKMVEQKIANERDRLNRPSSSDSGNDVENQLRLQQIMLRRQELLDKIRHEQTLNEQQEFTTRRPRSYSFRRRYTPSPNPPPSRRSLPELNAKTYRGEYNNTYRENNYQQMPLTVRNSSRTGINDMNQTRHIVEHRVEQPKTYHLPPIQNPVPQIIQQVPHPVIAKIGGEEGKQSFFNKGDFMEMMMMQNAQMHQLVMQQMMMSSLPNNNNNNNNRPSILGGIPMVAEAAPVMPMALPRQQSVHHHHYSQQPMMQATPAIHHFQSAVPMGGMGMSPARAHTVPGYFHAHDDGSNYYVYH